MINNDTSTNNITVNSNVIEPNEGIVFVWDGTAWAGIELSENLFEKLINDIRPITDGNNIDLRSGGFKDTNVTTAIKLGDGSNLSFNTINKTIVGAINELKVNAITEFDCTV